MTDECLCGNAFRFEEEQKAQICCPCVANPARFSEVAHAALRERDAEIEELKKTNKRLKELLAFAQGDNEALRDQLRIAREVVKAAENFLVLFDVHGRTGKTPDGYHDAYLILWKRVQDARAALEKMGGRK